VVGHGPPIHMGWLFMYSFNSVYPSDSLLTHAWSTSFPVGRLLYTLRFEAGSISQNGWQYFLDEVGLSNLQSDIGHVLKFDNNLNDIELTRAFLRLPADQKLKADEIDTLNRHLVGAVNCFCDDYVPEIVLGLPNDLVLARWYRRLIAKNASSRYMVRMEATSFHKHPVLIMRRM
jgi:hypothetical protein